MQELADGLTHEKIDALLRKWQAKLPQPFSAQDVAAGDRYDVSILPSEFSLTQVLDRPQTGRIFFEEVLRENLPLRNNTGGRPDQVRLIFNRRVTKRTPGRFRTRVLTEGVAPSLHVDDKHSKIKPYHKAGRALRTETTLNDSRDFGIGKRLFVGRIARSALRGMALRSCFQSMSRNENLPALREVGFPAHRR